MKHKTKSVSIPDIKVADDIPSHKKSKTSLSKFDNDNEIKFSKSISHDQSKKHFPYPSAGSKVPGIENDIFLVELSQLESIESSENYKEVAQTNRSISESLSFKSKSKNDLEEEQRKQEREIYDDIMKTEVDCDNDYEINECFNKLKIQEYCTALATFVSLVCALLYHDLKNTFKEKNELGQNRRIDKAIIEGYLICESISVILFSKNIIYK